MIGAEHSAHDVLRKRITAAKSKEKRPKYAHQPLDTVVDLLYVILIKCTQQRRIVLSKSSKIPITGVITPHWMLSHSSTSHTLGFAASLYHSITNERLVAFTSVTGILLLVDRTFNVCKV